MNVEVDRIEHHRLFPAVISRQTHQHQGEDAILRPPLPMPVERLVRPVGSRGNRPP